MILCAAQVADVQRLGGDDRTRLGIAIQVMAMFQFILTIWRNFFNRASAPLMIL